MQWQAKAQKDYFDSHPEKLQKYHPMSGNNDQLKAIGVGVKQANYALIMKTPQNLFSSIFSIIFAEYELIRSLISNKNFSHALKNNMLIMIPKDKLLLNVRMVINPSTMFLYEVDSVHRHKSIVELVTKYRTLLQYPLIEDKIFRDNENNFYSFYDREIEIEIKETLKFVIENIRRASCQVIKASIAEKIVNEFDRETAKKQVLKNMKDDIAEFNFLKKETQANCEYYFKDITKDNQFNLWPNDDTRNKLRKEAQIFIEDIIYKPEKVDENEESDLNLRNTEATTNVKGKNSKVVKDTRHISSVTKDSSNLEEVEIPLERKIKQRQNSDTDSKLTSSSDSLIKKTNNPSPIVNSEDEIKEEDRFESSKSSKKKSKEGKKEKKDKEIKKKDRESIEIIKDKLEEIKEVKNKKQIDTKIEVKISCEIVLFKKYIDILMKDIEKSSEIIKKLSSYLDIKENRIESKIIGNIKEQIQNLISVLSEIKLEIDFGPKVKLAKVAYFIERDHRMIYELISQNKYLNSHYLQPLASY